MRARFLAHMDGRSVQEYLSSLTNQEKEKIADSVSYLITVGFTPYMYIEAYYTLKPKERLKGKFYLDDMMELWREVFKIKGE